MSKQKIRITREDISRICDNRLNEEINYFCDIAEERGTEPNERLFKNFAGTLKLLVFTVKGQAVAKQYRITCSDLRNEPAREKTKNELWKMINEDLSKKYIIVNK